MRIMLAGAVLGLGILCSCSTPETSGAATQDASWRSSTLNAVCIFTGKAIDPAVPTADYRDGKIGFCCSHCYERWLAMDAAARDAAFAAFAKR